MRFLMITTFYPPYSFGGDAAYIARLAHSLARRGHDVEVVHCADAFHILHPGPPGGQRIEAERVTVHTLKHPLGALSPLLTQQTGRSVLKATRLKSLLGARPFDVVHYHNMSLIGLDALELGRAVKLYTTHEHWLVCPMHVLWRNNREACTTPTCFSCQLRSGRPPQWWRYGSLKERMVRHVDQFLCPSRFTLEKHRELGFDGPMTHLPYFLPDLGQEVSAARPRSSPYALFVGRLEKIKGVQNLIETFRRYRGCDLVIVGDGAYESELKRQAADLSHVVFLGRLSYEALRAWYRHALAVVVPSICYEVFGIVILEGFAVSTPALVTPYGALPEVVQDSGGGVVYADDEHLVEALERLRREPGWRADLGARGREAYERLWSEAPHLDRYFSIIETLSRRGNGGCS